MCGTAKAEVAAVEVATVEETLTRHIRTAEGPLLIALPDLSGALLVTHEGYALLAGTDAFLDHSVPEGTDKAIVDFRRYAARTGRRNPTLRAVADAFRPSEWAWASTSQVAPESATANQLSLMEAFTADGISAEDFARSWLAARREAMHRHERLRDPLSAILDQVFYALDEYVIDPGLRDADDMTDEQLRQIVSEQSLALAAEARTCGARVLPGEAKATPGD
ncbi:colicin immunity domain-containing protein [Streptomyces boluensis]|uniref:Colicin D immunity protein domain-containing protein n=1 Tax=Streptomyces boluensis TaxID=1775135 RepID=A0A964UST4_9ACTN|nr:colicin immunity domain-containing protein [Streptomyces boluensis]NBE54764.1 hypothetical protein [Streptomyces boluensis]